MVKALTQEGGTRDNVKTEIMAAASPWFIGVGKHLVVRK